VQRKQAIEMRVRRQQELLVQEAMAELKVTVLDAKLAV
jgi:hypothetical protein